MHTRVWPVAVIALCGVAVLAGGSASGASKHTATAARPVGRQLVMTKALRSSPARTLVVKWGGARWRIRGVYEPPRDSDRWRLDVSRRIGRAWVLQGKVELPSRGPWPYLRTADLTKSGAPDVIVQLGGGADWTALTVVSRVHGTWQTVPFDGSYIDGGRGARVIDGWTIVGDRVQGKMDSCGCAGGPETFSWYRFDGRMFAPTTPPGPVAACTAVALGAARGLPGPPEVVGPPSRLAAPFHAERFTCLNGWALARDRSGRYGLFEQTATFGLFKVPPRIWFRTSVGTLDRIRRDAMRFAIPESLTKRLEKRLGRP